MANFRTTADILDSILLRSGEVTNGNSAYESRALQYLNRINHAIIAGGNEFETEINEPWLWAEAEEPMIIELQPKYNTGTISLTNGSEVGAFSAAVTDSLKGWHIKVEGRDGVYKIAKHDAGATAFELDGAYDGTTGATLTYRAIKLDYELVPSYIKIDDTNNKMDFEETAATELTATIASGSYTPSDLAAAIDTALTSAGASSYTISYSDRTRKFTLASDRAGGGGTFKLLAASGSNTDAGIWATIGFDDEDQADAASHTGAYILGGISRLTEPFTMHKGNDIDRFGNGRDSFLIDKNRFKREYPINRVTEGYPTRMTKIIEKPDGSVWVRFNKYTETTTRIEIPYIPVPRDLKDNAVSVPTIPRKYLDVLEYGTASELLFEKEDTKWEGYALKAKAKLGAMMLNNRNEIERTSEDYGQIIAREDLLSRNRKKFLFGTPVDN